MDLQTITLPVEEAKRKFAEYRTAVRNRHNAEDEAIMRGYREIARGRQIITLTDTIRAGGTFDTGLPRIAVCRADAKWCHVLPGYDGEVLFYADPPDRLWSVRTPRGQVGSRVVKLPDGTLPKLTQSNATWDIRNGRMRSQVPIIPPALRPATKLGKFHVLWEVEQWAKAPLPPGDPALLRHITGDLWAVLAVWDLTELERAILGGRPTV